MGKNSPFLLFSIFHHKVKHVNFQAYGNGYRQRFKDNKKLLRLGYKDGIHKVPDFDSHLVQNVSPVCIVINYWLHVKFML